MGKLDGLRKIIGNQSERELVRVLYDLQGQTELALYDLYFHGLEEAEWASIEDGDRVVSYQRFDGALWMRVGEDAPWSEIWRAPVMKRGAE